MAETIGSLCDKLTILQLKIYHTQQDPEKQKALSEQCHLLKGEIDEYLIAACRGEIPNEYMSSKTYKVYDYSRFQTSESTGTFSELFLDLAKINCDLWHEQEKVYDFERVPEGEKNKVVKRLAVLNLERNSRMDSLNKLLASKIARQLK